MTEMTEHTAVREIGIDAAHRVPDHRSKCQNLHGHRYTIQLHCVGSLAAEGEQRGMVVDFGFMKDLMMQVIDEDCDHGVILAAHDIPAIETMLAPQWSYNQVRDAGGFDLDGVGDPCKRVDPKYLRHTNSKVYLMGTVPTAENLARHWYRRLEPGIARLTEGRARIHMVRVWETPNCHAEYPRR